MTNQAIADLIDLTARLLEIKDENPFKIKAYQKAAESIEASEISIAELLQKNPKAKIDGVGASIQAGLLEILHTGSYATLEQLKGEVPPGLLDLSQISGVGPKKLRQLWLELGITTVDALYEACRMGHLGKYKGFGIKTQQNYLTQIETFQQNRGKVRLDDALEVAVTAISVLKDFNSISSTEIVGQTRRYCSEIENVGVLISTNEPEQTLAFLQSRQYKPESSPVNFADAIQSAVFISPEGRRLAFYFGKPENAETDVLFLSQTEQFPIELAEIRSAGSSADYFAQKGLPELPPELFDLGNLSEKYREKETPRLLKVADIRGVVHAHTTWSDGKHTLREMAEAAKSQGFEYLTITDHSQTAIYANGLKPERIVAQWAEIEQLNAELAPFRIFKGVESDILIDGSLDYEADLLKGFDIIIGSIHSQFNMDEATATRRLIKAVENPFTTMLGHPTGRLLLNRKGYEINHIQVIDACAANGVSIEINANPWRLDIDWRWLDYALSKGIFISINPDAHSIRGISDIRYGVLTGRKGGLTAAQTLNARDAAGFEAFLKERR